MKSHTRDGAKEPKLNKMKNEKKNKQQEEIIVKIYKNKVLRFMSC